MDPEGIIACEGVPPVWCFLPNTISDYYLYSGGQVSASCSPPPTIQHERSIVHTAADLHKTRHHSPLDRHRNPLSSTLFIRSTRWLNPGLLSLSDQPESPQQTCLRVLRAITESSAEPGVVTIVSNIPPSTGSTLWGSLGPDGKVGGRRYRYVDPLTYCLCLLLTL